MRSDAVLEQDSLDRKDKRTVEPANYQNLSWTKPGLKLQKATNSNVANTSTAAAASLLSPPEEVRNILSTGGAGQKVNFNGLTNVPTGPKANARTTLPSLEQSEKRPHIFIPASSLPPNPSTVTHLYKFLVKYVKNIKDVSLLAEGYYIFFSDTEEGLRRLDQCYNSKNGEKMFSQYTLDMLCYPTGRTCASTTTPTSRETETNPTAASTNESDGGATQILTSDQPPVASRSKSRQEEGRTTSDSGVEFVEHSNSTLANIQQTSHSATPPFRYSSPLRVPSRLDRDDSSSVSGFTGSDISKSKPGRCHQCKDPPSALKPLTHCSSCRRKYCGPCHNEYPIPRGLQPGHSWQCKRCTKNKVPPNSELSKTPVAAAISPAPCIEQLDERPSKKPKLDETMTEAAPVTPSIDADTNPMSRMDFGVDDVLIMSVEKAGDGDMHGVTNHGEPAASSPQINSDELRFQEADDLVEQSFTPTGHAAKPQTSSKKSLLQSLTRKKRPQADSNNNTNRPFVDNNDASIQGIEMSKNTNTKSHVDNATSTETSLKREPHRWKGNGADKDIIQAGMQRLFTDIQTSTHQQESIDTRPQGYQRKPITTSSRYEVPESPEELRASNTGSQPADEGDATSTMHCSLKTKVKLTIPATEPRQRMKPGGASADKCSRCSRTIAFNPFGGPKYCSKCKKAASVESADTATAAIGKPVADEAAASGATDTAAGIERGVLDLLQSPSFGEEKLPESAAPDVEDKALESRSTQSRRACEACRAQNKRCTHEEQKAARHGDDTFNDEDLGKDDLDFWNAAPELGTGEHPADGDSSADMDMSSPHAEVVTRESRDETSSLSPAPEDAATAAKKTKKRQSFTKKATSEYDLGDAYSRPNNSYKKLINMALCAAENHRLKSSQIVGWIAANIPGYHIGVGNKWEGGISATLSMQMLRDTKPDATWKKVGGDETNRHIPCWYQLLPEKEYEVPHWDPVIKQAVSPIKHRPDEELSDTHESPLKGQSRDVPEGIMADVLASPSQMPKPRLRLHGQKAPDFPSKHAPQQPKHVHKLSLSAEKLTDSFIEQTTIPDAHDHVAYLDDESSDDEPIANKRVKALARFLPKGRFEPPDIAEDEDAVMIDDMEGLQDEYKDKTLTDKIAEVSQLLLPRLQITAQDNTSLADLIKKDADHTDYTAKSLFTEWPEFDPKNEIDRKQKIAEIRKRLPWKQRMSTPGLDPWIKVTPVRWNHNSNNAKSSHNLRRPTDDDSTNDTACEASESMQCFNTIEEMFGLSPDCVPFIQNKQIAYREKTQVDGTLRRPKALYYTGYAKDDMR